MSRAMILSNGRVTIIPYGDPHAHEALSLYATRIEGDAPALAGQLRALLQSEGAESSAQGHFDFKGFGLCLRTERQRRGLSMPQLCAQVGVSKFTIQRLETGSNGEVESMMRLCQWMNASPLDFWVRE